MTTTAAAATTTRTITIDGRRHQVRHIGPRAAAIIAESAAQSGGYDEPLTLAAALWAAHLETLARAEWGPRGYVRSSRLDSQSRDGSVKVYELTLCRDTRGGSAEFVRRWATRDRDELQAAAAAIA